MEDGKHHDFSANNNNKSFSWWSDSHNHRLLHQSPWLQSTLSDLDEKVKMIVNVIQDDGDSFTERAEMFYKRRPQLLKILHDLHNSYRSLAEKYDHLISSSSSSPPPPLKILHNTTTTPPDNTTNKLENDSSDNDRFNNKDNQEEKVKDESKTEEEKIWSGLRLRVSKLIEDNRRQQAELIRRNDEKREVIKQLRSQVNRLMEENRALITCLPTYKHLDFKPTESTTTTTTTTNVSKLRSLNCIGNFHH